MLIDAGADVNFRGDSGYPVQAGCCGIADITRLFDSWLTRVRISIQLGPLVQSTRVSRHEYEELVQLLFGSGENVNSLDYIRKDTPPSLYAASTS
jgi:hypothetical protein